MLVEQSKRWMNRALDAKIAVGEREVREEMTWMWLIILLSWLLVVPDMNGVASAVCSDFMAYSPPNPPARRME